MLLIVLEEVSVDVVAVAVMRYFYFAKKLKLMFR